MNIKELNRMWNDEDYSKVSIVIFIIGIIELGLLALVLPVALTTKILGM